MKKLLSALLSTTLILGLAACGKTEAPAASTANNTPTETSVILKMHHAGVEGDAYYQGAEKFAQLVNEYSNGSVTVEVYPNSELASSSDAVQGVQMGTIDIGLESSMTEANFIKDMNVLNLPFLFSDYDQVWTVLDGQVGEDLAVSAEEAGFKLLYFWDNGFRNISNKNVAINSVQDLTGLKIRVAENDVFIATFEALGAIPTPMAWSEVYSALQLGTVDGQENPNGHMISYNLTEVQNYYAITNHVYTAEPLLMNLDKFNSLSQSQQDAIMKAAQEAGDFERELREQINNDTLQQIKDAGVQVTTPELEGFRAAAQSVYDSHGADYADLLAKIQEITG